MANIPNLVDAEIREFLFDRIEHGRGFEIPQHLFNNSEVRFEDWTETKAVQFFTEVAGKKDDRSKTVGYATVKYPDGWWQSFKADWFPEWLLDRFPVRYTEERVKQEIIYKVTASFPDIEVPKLADEKYIQFFQTVMDEKQRELEKQFYNGK